MVFSSLPFLFAFLPALLLAYFTTRDRARDVVLLGASLFFYAWGGWDFFVILVAFVIAHWAGGLWIERVRTHGTRRSVHLVLGLFVVLDVGLIGWFKYANFAVGELNHLMGWLGNAPLVDSWQRVILPIGISFFTFQGLSYLIDVARGTVRALANPLHFALYEALFPQLIAGPIVRYAEIADQIAQRKVALQDFCTGLMRFVHGLAKKVLIADSVSLWADAAFAAPDFLSAPEAWVGAIAYGLQIYFDFSGYSDMAIGLGRMLGFRFPENFNHPYAATSVTDFWRRWHMTLTRWFRDYLYIPLGGSRRSALITSRNLLVVFIATGIWHGANWTFLIWGLWHGAWLMWERHRGIGRGADQRPRAGRWRMAIVVLLGWIIFRADTILGAGAYFEALIGLGRGGVSFATLAPHMWWLPVTAFIVGLGSILPRDRVPWGERLLDTATYLRRPWVSYASITMFALVVLSLLSGAVSPFLYFRF